MMKGIGARRSRQHLLEMTMAMYNDVHARIESMQRLALDASVRASNAQDSPARLSVLLFNDVDPTPTP